jgi:hypothetical protein
MNMPLATIVTGVLSILLGVGLFAFASADGSRPLTALIPVIPGAIFVVLGALARKPSLRKHMMHAAAIVALLIVLAGLGMGVPKLVKYYSDSLPAGTTPRPLAYWGQIALAVIFGVFEVLCVRSFIAAAKTRRAAAV